MRWESFQAILGLPETARVYAIGLPYALSPYAEPTTVPPFCFRVFRAVWVASKARDAVYG